MTCGPMACWTSKAMLCASACTGRGVLSCAAAAVKRAKVVRKERCPAKSERPVMGLRLNKDFIHENAVSNIR